MAKYNVTLQPRGEEFPFDKVTVNNDDTFTFRWTVVQGEFSALNRDARTAAADSDAWKAYIAEYVDPADVKLSG